MEINMREPRKR